MKNLKIKTASAALLLTLFAANVSAQPQNRAPRGGERPTAEKAAEISTDKLDQKLDLTDAQESKIYKINLSYAQKAELQREETKSKREAAKSESAKPQRPDRSEMREHQKAAQESKKAHSLEIMAVLTDSQKLDYAMLIAKETRHKEMRKGQQGKPQQGGVGRGEQRNKPEGRRQGGSQPQHRAEEGQPKAQ
ncbi:MAG: Spy/CpxP family protein refolding chaperone [Rikenellaceae bacterium]